MATKSNKTTSNEESENVDSKKTNKIAEKLKSMGMMGSAKKLPETESNKTSSLLMTLIVATPVAFIVAYLVMPDQLNELFSSSNANVNRNSNGYYAQPQNYMGQNMGNQNHARMPEWVTQQRAENDKRRAEFEKWNTNNYSQNRMNNEPPQWIKDQQAQMQKEQEKYQQEWAQRSADMSYNQYQAPHGYMNRPPVNGYQSNQAVANNQPWMQKNQSPVYGQNPAPYYNGYAQPVNPHGYNNGPYNGPYSQNGYPYR